jgi:hypothetical protein
MDSLFRSHGCAYLPEVHPDNEWWRESSWGWLLRYRGILAAMVANNGIGFVGFLLGQPWIAGAFAGLSILVTAGLLLERRHHVYRLKVDEALHSLTHEIRDRANKVLSLDESLRPSEIEHFHDHIIEKIAAYFRLRVRDPGVSCCIRIAEIIDNKVHYATVARASGLNEERKESSVPIAHDEGIAKALIDHRSMGAFLINSLHDAKDAKVWKQMENDKYEDAKVFLVCPINGWQGGKRTMIGIFFLTAKNASLTSAHWLPQKAIADLLGLVYPILYFLQKQRASSQEPAVPYN